MLQIRKSEHRGEDGFLVCGRDPLDRRVSIFARSRSAAERIKAKVAKGEEIGVEDFEALEETDHA